jgi:hypothetical protein
MDAGPIGDEGRAGFPSCPERNKHRWRLAMNPSRFCHSKLNNNEDSGEI